MGSTRKGEDIVSTGVKASDVCHLDTGNNWSNAQSFLTFKRTIMEKKEISFAPGFFVDQDGIVYEENGRSRKTYQNGDGYTGVSIKTSDGVWITFGVHRLVALEFISNNRPDRTEVNHRDCDKGNNRVSNLEWVTPSENNIHSEIHKVGNYIPTIKSFVNGELHRYYLNIHEASEFLGLTTMEIWDAIKDGKVVLGSLSFEYRYSNEGVPDQFRKSHFREGCKGRMPIRRVKIMDVRTGEVKFYDSVSLAAKAFDTSTGHICSSIPTPGRLRILKDYYRVQYATEEFEYFNPEMIENFGTNAKDVIAYNTFDRKYHIFESAGKFVITNKLSKKAVTTALKNNRLRMFDIWVPIYLNDRNMKALKTFVEGLDSLSVQ